MPKISDENIRRKNPINRNNLFTSDRTIDFQVSIGMEYINKILNQTVVLYEVDRENTKIDGVIYEAKFDDLVFKTPVELNVMYKLDKAELQTYDNTSIKGYYLKVGKLDFTIYDKELIENDCDIHRGDYIGLQVTNDRMEYFVVTDDGRVNYDNAHTLWGTKPVYRTISCSVVSDMTETQNI